MPANDNYDYAYGDHSRWVDQRPCYFVNGTPVYLVGGTTWVSGGALTTGPGWPYAYSIGGGAVAPVPQGPAMAAKPADPKLPEYDDVTKAAEAALRAFDVYSPPACLELRVKRQDKPVTSGALERALVELAREKYPSLRTERANVGIKWIDSYGTTFTIEGVWRK
jgi:hypothetical protein